MWTKEVQAVLELGARQGKETEAQKAVSQVQPSEIAWRGPIYVIWLDQCIVYVSLYQQPSCWISKSVKPNCAMVDVAPLWKE